MCIALVLIWVKAFQHNENVHFYANIHTMWFLNEALYSYLQQHIEYNCIEIVYALCASFHLLYQYHTIITSAGHSVVGMMYFRGQLKTKYNRQ